MNPFIFRASENSEPLKDKNTSAVPSADNQRLSHGLAGELTNFPSQRSSDAQVPSLTRALNQPTVQQDKDTSSPRTPSDTLRFQQNRQPFQALTIDRNREILPKLSLIDKSKEHISTSSISGESHRHLLEDTTDKISQAQAKANLLPDSTATQRVNTEIQSPIQLNLGPATRYTSHSVETPVTSAPNNVTVKDDAAAEHAVAYHKSNSTVFNGNANTVRELSTASTSDVKTSHEEVRIHSLDRQELNYKTANTESRTTATDKTRVIAENRIDSRRFVQTGNENRVMQQTNGQDKGSKMNDVKTEPKIGKLDHADTIKIQKTDSRRIDEVKANRDYSRRIDDSQSKLADKKVTRFESFTVRKQRETDEALRVIFRDKFRDVGSIADKLVDKLSKRMQAPEVQNITEKRPQTVFDNLKHPQIRECVVRFLGLVERKILPENMTPGMKMIVRLANDLGPDKLRALTERIEKTPKGEAPKFTDFDVKTKFMFVTMIRLVMKELSTSREQRINDARLNLLDVAKNVRNLVSRHFGGKQATEARSSNVKEFPPKATDRQRLQERSQRNSELPTGKTQPTVKAPFDRGRSPVSDRVGIRALSTVRGPIDVRSVSTSTIRQAEPIKVLEPRVRNLCNGCGAVNEAGAGRCVLCKRAMKSVETKRAQHPFRWIREIGRTFARIG
jgi:hypothetical protein